MHQRTTFDPTFDAYARELEAIAACVGDIAPFLEHHPAVLPVFVKGAILLVVLRLESFLTSLLVRAVHLHEAVARDYVREHGTLRERALAARCTRNELVTMVARRGRFTTRGTDLDRVFQVLLGFDLWPDWHLPREVGDLVLVRNALVGKPDRVRLAEVRLAQQRGLFVLQTEGHGTTYHVSYPHVLILLQDMLAGLDTQVRYLRNELLKRAEWIARSGAQAAPATGQRHAPPPRRHPDSGARDPIGKTEGGSDHVR